MAFAWMVEVFWKNAPRPPRFAGNVFGSQMRMKSRIIYRSFHLLETMHHYCSDFCLWLGFSEPRAMLLLPAGLIRSFTETSATWYAWLGMSPTRRQIRPLCPACWLHWKRYACLRLPWKRNIERCNMSMPQFLPTPSLFPSKSLALGSACKQLLLSHRSPPPPEQCTFDSTEELGNGQAKGSVDEEEFEYVADRSWIIKRRVASESLYVPRRVALYPQMAVRDAETVDEYYRSCPAMVFAYHQQLVKKRRISIDQVISKVSLLKKQA